MAKKLKNIRLTSVDLVHRGANQQAHICIHKSDDSAGAPTEGEKNIFKRFLAWMRENPTEAQDEPENPIEKADYNSVMLHYTDALAKSIQSIHADSTLDDEGKLMMIQKSFEQFDNAVQSYNESIDDPADDPGVTKSEPEIIEIEEVDTKKA